MKKTLKNLCTILILVLLLVCCASCGNNEDKFIDIVKSSCMSGYDGTTYQEVLESTAKDGTVLWYYSKEISEYGKISEDGNGKKLIDLFDKSNYVEASWFDEEMNHYRFFFEVDAKENVILLGMPDPYDDAIMGGESLMHMKYADYIGIPANDEKSNEETIEYEGNYIAYDESDLSITNINGEWKIEIGLVRLTFIDDGVGEVDSESNTMSFVATDASCDPIGGEIKWENADDVVLEFTNSTWEYLPNGSKFFFKRAEKSD